MSTQSTYNQKIPRLLMESIPKQPENIPGLSIYEAPSSQSVNPGVMPPDHLCLT